MAGEPIAVLGRAVGLPLGLDSPEKLYQAVREKRQMSRNLVEAGTYPPRDVQVGGREQPWKIKNPWACCMTKEEATSVDPAFFQFSPKQAKTVQLEQLLVLQTVYHAIEDAGLTLKDLHRTTTGIFVGGYSSFGFANMAPDETMLKGHLMSSMADQVAYWLGTHGPSMTTETACSSSLVALSLAVAALQRHECDVAIVAGCNPIISKDFHLGLQACGVLVEGPTCHPFNEDGPAGFLRCEGSGSVVLRRLSDAEAHGDRILCEIAGGVTGAAGAAEGVSSGCGRVYESPCRTGMVEMMTRACQLAHVQLQDVDYVECHATGTAVGDVIELSAVGAVYGDAHSAVKPVRVATVKSNIGHAEMAAGMFSLIKSVESLHNRIFLPSAGVTVPRKDFDWQGHHVALQQEAEPFPRDKRVVIGINSFGIGGSYAHVLVREYQPSSRVARPLRALPGSSAPLAPAFHLLFPLSAHSLAHLTLHAKNIADYLRQPSPPASLADVCGTMAVRRTRFPFRRSFVARSVEDLAEQLGALADKPPAIQACAEDKNIKVLFVLTGQGSQWAKNGSSLLKTLPAYRDVVKRADALFSRLSGWSILEKIETLSTEEMRDTTIAQPVTFLVQVGLLEALQSFNVFPNMVMGHSAGEVAAAYAAGLLTLEEAVMVVYHRSQEQQRLAGSGRMLAVGLGLEDVTRLLEQKGLAGEVSVACINSPTGTVLAGPEARLAEVRQGLQTGVSATFIPGNIAFHSQYVAPIMESMRRRLSFLNQHASESSWSLPFISTVTGRLETRVDADYFVQNLRKPVLFRKAVEAAYSMDTPPEVVIEIGPHRTLVGPLLQTVGAMEGTSVSVTALPLLNRKEDCLASFLKALGTLIDRGVDVSLKGYFDSQLSGGYQLDGRLPKHPYIKQDLRATWPHLFLEQNAAIMWAGPVAGKRRVDGDSWMIEVSDRTCASLMDHKMGGEAIIPGAWYIEMVLEAVGLPCTVTDVEFRSKLAIPRATTGDYPVLVFLTLKHEQDGWQSFVIKSCALRGKVGEDAVHVEHCVGRVYKGDHLLTPEGQIRHCRQPGGQGLLQDLEMQDLGVEGLRQLIDRHSKVEHSTRESFYETYSAEGKNDYGPHFQGVSELRVDPIRQTVLGKIDIDNTGWAEEGGVLMPEILDSVIHLGLYSADPSIIYYAGGYEAVHALRRPATKELWACYVPDRQMVQVGRRKRGGDYLVYDGHGNLVLYKVGSFYLFAITGDSHKVTDLSWQPMGVSAPATLVAQAMRVFQDEQDDGRAAAFWSAERHARMDEWVRARTEVDTAEAASFPAVAGLDERGEALVQAVTSLKAQEKVQAPTPKKATTGEGEGGRTERLSDDDMAQLVRLATGQVVEASAIGEALANLAKSEQAKAGGGFVLIRVMEVVEAEGCPTAIEALSHIHLPHGIQVEAFVASHSNAVLRSLLTRVSRRNRQMVTRRVLLPSDRGFFKELRDLTMHALVVDDWVRTGASAYTDNGASNAARQLLRLWSPFLAPGAHVMVRGFNPVPSWVRTLSCASNRPITTHSVDADTVASEAAAAEWREALEGMVTTGPLSVLAGAMPAKLACQGGRYLVVGHSRAQAAEIAEVVEQEAQGAEGGVSVTTLIVDDEVKAEAIAESLEAAYAEGPIAAVLFAAGLDDQSLVGEDGHSRLGRFLQAVIMEQDLIVNHTNRLQLADPTKERPFIYVLTEGVYAGKIRPNQAALQGFIVTLHSENRVTVGKHIDMATTTTVSSRRDCPLMRRAVQAVLGRSREFSLSVRSDGDMAARYREGDVDKARQVELGPSDQRCYYAAPQRGAHAMRKAQIVTPGVVQASFQLCDLPPPAADEVTVEVEAAALNFRDVMISLSLLPEQSYERSFFGKEFGMEAAGVVSAVGKDVTDVKVGDRVVCAEPRTFTNRLNCKAERLGRVAPGTSLVDAASAPSVYNTCQHALINLARIRKGERVLVHSAAGGIGHAAIAVCQYVGAEVIATAGTESKRELVRELGVTHVFDSRSTSWYEDVMSVTKGQGVDVVLNSLAGTHQRLGLQALRSSGRFCEIGKVDIFSNSSLGLLAFRKNISFFAIDMDRLALDDPELTKQVTAEVGARFLAGDYKPLPVTVYPMGQIKQALELMKTGKHVGKVVLVNHDADGREHKVSVEQPQTTFRPDISYLITGAAGGFGQRLLVYAVHMGARHFVISTTKPDAEAARRAFRDVLGELSGEVTIEVVISCDTGSRQDVERLVQAARAMSPPCKAVIHVAGISQDVRIPDLKDREDYAKVAGPKALGAWWLSELTRDMGLEAFVTISSVSVRQAGTGMATYTAANAFLDSLVRYRRSIGLPGLTYNMGSLVDVGILSKNAAARNWQRKLGIDFITSYKALETLEAGLVVGFDPYSASVIEASLPIISSYAELIHLIDDTITLGDTDTKAGPTSLKDLAGWLAEEMKAITQATEVNLNTAMSQLGLDSFGFIELGGRIQKAYNMDVNSLKLSPEKTLMDVATIMSKLMKRESEEEECSGDGDLQVGALELAVEAEELDRADVAKLLRHREQAAGPNDGQGSRKDDRVVFLLGATGIVGAHVLRYLFKLYGAQKVYCLVRAGTREAGFARIRNALMSLSLWKDSFADKIVPVTGDLAKARFGMAPDEYEEVRSSIGGVVNAAGGRTWSFNQDSADCNTKGLMTTVELARESGAVLHFVSTTWLDIYEAADPHDRVTLRALPYVSIKQRAEEILRFAAKQCHVACNVIRLPLVGVNTRGKFQGELVTFIVMQSMYLTGEAYLPRLGVFPYMAGDLVGKEFVRQMQRMRHPPTGGRGPLYRMHSLALVSEYLTTQELCDIVDELMPPPRRVDRSVSLEQHHESLCEVFSRQFIEASNLYPLLQAIFRAAETMADSVRKSWLASSLSRRVKNEAWKGRSAIETFREYVRAHPELVTENSLAEMARDYATTTQFLMVGAEASSKLAGGGGSSSPTNSSAASNEVSQ